MADLTIPRLAPGGFVIDTILAYPSLHIPS